MQKNKKKTNKKQNKDKKHMMHFFNVKYLCTNKTYISSFSFVFPGKFRISCWTAFVPKSIEVVDAELRNWKKEIFQL